MSTPSTSLIDRLSAAQRAELHALTRAHDDWLILREENGYVYASLPDVTPYIWASYIGEQPEEHHEAVRLFTPAPNVIPGQLAL